jgi:hypothetical protein
VVPRDLKAGFFRAAAAEAFNNGTTLPEHEKTATGCSRGRKIAFPCKHLEKQIVSPNESVPAREGKIPSFWLYRHHLIVTLL